MIISCLWVSVLDNILLLFCCVPTKFLHDSLKCNVFKNADIQFSFAPQELFSQKNMNGMNVHQNQLKLLED